MSDIVKRLRAEGALDAADEIEDLRAEVSNILAENDALRFALNNAGLQIAAARREGIEAAIEIVERTISPWSIAASDECAAAILALLKEDEG